MIQELDLVVLLHDLPEHNLQQRDVGTVVHCYPGGAEFEVEFVMADGETLALLTLEAAQVRPLDQHEILHAREVGAT